MGECFNLLTFNVKGLQSKIKRLQIFDYCKEKIKMNGIVLLQESHSSAKDAKRWAKEWKGDLFQNHGSSNSRGTLIGFSEGFEKKLLKYIDDKNGRIQLLAFEHKCKKYLIVNLYNNNIEKDQVQTLKKIDTFLQNFQNLEEYSIVMGGDWNFIMDKELDAYGGNPKLKLNSIAEYTKLTKKFLLGDIYRIRNIDLKRFTFRQKTPCLARRLDRFIISNSLQTRVSLCEILPSLLSDHSPLVMTIKTTTGDFRKGANYWKFNKLLLRDPTFTDEMRNKIREKKVELVDMDGQVKLELVKYEIRKYSMFFSKKKAKEKRRVLRQNESLIKDFETKPQNEHSIGQSEYDRAKQEIELYHLEKTKGNILRSKCQVYEEGEKSTKFFLGLEKIKAINGTIDMVMGENNNEINDYQGILKEIKNFYTSLFTKKQLDGSDNIVFLESLNLPKISDSDKIFCDADITIDELKASMLSMSDDKSPGNDGISKEFYNFFWDEMSSLLYDSFLSAKAKMELSPSQRQAIIKLLEKSDKDRRFIKNWRPISLLNIDVKIFNKALANRLKKVLSSIVGANQTAYVEGRFIGEATRLISDILDVTKECNIPGYMVMMDVEKAFDSMDHEFLLDALKVYGFGENFIKWIRIILTKQESCVMNGGNSTGYFNLGRGARQGDPISAYLFILVIEVFFQMIRKSRSIKGVNICGHVFNIVAYADDTTVFCRDLRSVQLVREAFDKFSKYSGLKLNSTKTEVCGIGVKRGVEIALCGMKSVNLLTESVKVLGVHFSYNEELRIEKNFISVIKKIEKVLAVWRMRALTLAGKITILKSLIFSKIVFVSFLTDIPNAIVKSLIKIKNEFLWGGKPPKIKHSAMIGSYERGGLKDIDIEKRLKALRLSWVRRLYDDSIHEWKVIPKFYLEKYSQNIFYPNLKIEVKNNIPKFYKNIIREWEEIAACEPLTRENVLIQSIRFNRKILINNNVITYKEASNLFIQNFYNENGVIMDWTTFKQKNGMSDQFSFKWRQIIAAIPRGWKDKIRSESELGVVGYAEPEPHLQAISRKLLLKRLSGKEIYTLLLSRIWEKPSSEEKIEQMLGINDLNWAKIYILGRRITIDSYSRQFYFKLTHNILFLNKSLKRMNLVESSLCPYCKTVDETPIHLFAECSYVGGLWGQLQIFFEDYIHLGEITPQSAILGWQNEEVLGIIKNQILLIFKMVVYKYRDVGFCSLDMFINKLRMIKNIEHSISTNRDFNNRKWNSIGDLLD